MEWGTLSQQGSWPKAMLLIAALAGSQRWETVGSIPSFPQDPRVCQDLCFWDPVSCMGIWLQGAAGKAWFLWGSSRGSNHGKTFPGRALVYAFLTSSPHYVEVTCTMCPPETKISIFLICQHSLCCIGGRELVAQGCVGGLTLVFWLLCLPWEEVPVAVTVTKTGAQGLLFPAVYTLSG